MTADAFRVIALGFLGAVEDEHMGHPDFRYKGKIFATLDYPDDGWGMIKLTPAQQQFFIGIAPSVFALSNGAWGRKGSTMVHLQSADKHEVGMALQTAFKNIDALKRRPKHSRDQKPASGTSSTRGKPRRR
jgi:hypothetical protein